MLAVASNHPATDRGNNDVDVFALFHEESHLGLDEFFRHLLRIAALTFPGFLDIDLEKFGTERLNLFASGRTGVEAADNCAHPTGLKDVHVSAAELAVMRYQVCLPSRWHSTQRRQRR